MAASLPLATTGRRPPPPSNRGSNGGVVNNEVDPREWCAWTHQGHRLWVSMPDSFWIYTFKVLRCPYPNNHLWMWCPYAHRGERARRRDPSRFSYSPVGCPEYLESKRRNQLAGTNAAPACPRGLRCGYAHGIFETWLHPARFRTRMCDGGAACTRTICFFAHTPAQRRRADDHVPLVSFPPPPPPGYVPRAAAPALAALASSSSSSSRRLSVTRQVEVITQALHGGLRLNAIGAAASSSPSSRRASAITTTTAATVSREPALALMQAPPVGDDLDLVAMMRAYLASEEGSTTEGEYPYLDLLMDFVKS